MRLHQTITALLRWGRVSAVCSPGRLCGPGTSPRYCPKQLQSWPVVFIAGYDTAAHWRNAGLRSAELQFSVGEEMRTLVSAAIHRCWLAFRTFTSKVKLQKYSNNVWFQLPSREFSNMITIQQIDWYSHSQYLCRFVGPTHKHCKQTWQAEMWPTN